MNFSRRMSRSYTLRGRPQWGVFWFAVPALSVTALLIVAPVAYTVWLSVSHIGFDGSFHGFVGIAHFERAWNDPLFRSSARVTGALFLCCLVLECLIGVPLGVLLSMNVPGRGLFQAIVIIPTLMASVAVGTTWLTLLDPSLGVVNRFTEAILGASLPWLGDPVLAFWSIVLVDVWQWTPFIALLVTGGIRSIPPDMFEAAALDRATGWSLWRYVILPLVWPVITVAVLLRSLDLVRFFDTIYVMTQGGPLNATNALNVFAYRTAIVNGDVSYGAALQLSVLLLAVTVGACLVIARKAGRTS